MILGIGADDIFVLYDAFMQAKMQPTMKVSNANGDLDLSSMMAQRMSWALRRAVSAMAVTSLTTFAAFVVTALSPITNIKVFGIFAAKPAVYRRLPDKREGNLRTPSIIYNNLIDVGTFNH